MTLDDATITGILARHAEPLAFSGAIGVEDIGAGRTLYAGAFGQANRSDGIANTVETRFQIASGSKIFTSVAVCQLVERGLLSFTTRFLECLPFEFPHFDPRITVHDLLTHTSGITSYFEEDVDPDYEAVWRERPMYRVRSPRDFLPLFQHKHMKFAPGERFEYNDGGYILLGLVIEELSGMSFAAYVERNVLAPSGMTRSGYFQSDLLPERTAQAYIVEDGGRWRSNVFAVPAVGAPDGGAYATVHDMACFWKSLTGRSLLGDEMTGRLLHRHVAAPKEGAGVHYGYGVWLREAEGKTVEQFVAGWDPGVAMVSSMHPEAQLVITLLGNTNSRVTSIHDDIVKLAAARKG